MFFVAVLATSMTPKLFMAMVEVGGAEVKEEQHHLTDVSGDFERGTESGSTTLDKDRGTLPRRSGPVTSKLRGRNIYLLGIVNDILGYGGCRYW